MVVFIMKFLVYIQLAIIVYIDKLITIHIWTKGAQEKNVIMSQKWATQPCIYPNESLWVRF
jgi:hypothetical protein